jgi:hypothetical protein
MTGPFLEIGGEVVPPGELTLPRALELATLLTGGMLRYARLVECRRAPTAPAAAEAVVFDVTVERPQLLAHPVAREERLAMLFDLSPDVPPELLALRPDFPSVPHTNLRPRELPRSLCLDDRPWSEVSRRWTAAAFVQRVRWWLAETARGTLHQADQPLEPLVLDTAVPLILPPDLLIKPLQQHEFLSVRSLPGPEGTLALRAERAASRAEARAEYLAIALRCQPQHHGVIRHHPDTLDALHALTSAAGLDLKREIKARLSAWFHHSRLRECRLIILLSLPKQRHPAGPIEETDLVAVACFDRVAEVALKLGEWVLRKQAKKNRRKRPGNKGLAKSPKAGEPIRVFLLRPVFGLTPAAAAELNGVGPRPTERGVAIGAGALGSQVLLNLVRAGHATWDVIDDDRLFPHNLQRHGLDGAAVGLHKAEALALAANSLFDGPPVAAGIADNLLRPANGARVGKALAGANTLLDLSASVAVARHLAWRDDLKGRRVSLFLNPAGTDLVLLAEGADRGVPLDCLEMQYYRALLRENGLAGHLTPRDGRVRYSTSCRDVSVRMPTHLVALHAAIGAGAVASALGRPGPSITVWKTELATLAVTPFVVQAAPVRRERIGGWTLTIDLHLAARLHQLRSDKLPKETGGVLLGAYDMDRRCLYVVDSIPSPPDSEEWPALYIRGCEGLSNQVDAARARTGGQLEYVGEWHSHPDRCPVRPSGDDETVFAWLAGRLAGDGLPALMAIVGERGVSSWHLDRMQPGGGWAVNA